MHLLLDKIAATMVGTVVLLSLMAVQLRVQDSTADRSRFYASKTQLLMIGEVLQADLRNAGHAAKPWDAVMRSHAEDAADGPLVTRSLEFLSADSSAGQILVRYELERVGEQRVGADDRPLFRLRRFVDGASAGGSASTLTGFRVELLDESGAATATMANVRRMRVRVATALWMGGSATETLPELHWGLTVVPDGLERQDYQGGS